jgi:hypothetical protein
MAATGPTESPTGTPAKLSDDPIERIGQIVDMDDEGGEVGATPKPAATRDGKGRFGARPPGPPKKRAAKPTPEEVEAAAAATELEDSDEIEDPEEAGDPAAEAGADGESEEGASSEDEQPEGEVLLSLDELAGEFDVEPDEFAANVTVEGPDGEPVTLAHAIKEYQNQPAATAAAAEFDARRQELDQAHTERVAQADGELNKATRLVQVLMDDLKADDQQDWARLRRDLPPDEYLARRERHMNRDRLLQQSLAQLEQAADGRDKQVDSRKGEIAREEATKLHREMPAWRDPKRSKAAMTQMRNYLTKTRGFSDEDVDSVLDHRMVLVVWDALKGSKMKAPTSTALQRIRAAKAKGATARGLRPGPRERHVPTAAKKRAAARARLKRTGSVEDAAASLEGLL